MIPRWMHKLYANAMGYFWLPCPICGRMMGGHEEGGGALITSADGTSTGVCSRCGDMAAARNRAYLEDWLEERWLMRAPSAYIFSAKRGYLLAVPSRAYSSY